MAARDQIEGVVRKWKSIVLGYYDVGTATTKSSGGNADIRGVTLGGYHERRQMRKARQHLATARLKVQHRNGLSHPPPHSLGVPPARSLLGRSPGKPAEVPTLDRGCLRLCNQVLE